MSSSHASPAHPHFEDRRNHAWLKIDHCVPKEHRKGRLLDIACGTGNGVIAELQQGYTAAVGIDRSFGEFPWFKVEDFAAICRVYGVDPAAGLLVEGDLFGVSFPPRSFDCVLLLDAIEHVPEPARFIEKAAGYLAPGGYLIIDTAPLYYSKVGHHLYTYLTGEQYPWAHLRKDFAQLVEAAKIDAWSYDRYLELNKVTQDEVRRSIEAAGLTVTFEHRDVPTDADRNLLESLRPQLELDGIRENTLFEMWMLAVARRV